MGRPDSTFARAAVAMLAVGCLFGCAFPPFALVVGLPAGTILSPVFLAASVAIGLSVGAANIAIARLVIGRRVRTLAARMEHVARTLDEAAYAGDRSSVRVSALRLPVPGHDEIGASVEAFNALLGAFADSVAVDDAVRAFGSVVGGSQGLKELGAVAVEALLPAMDAYGAALTVRTDDGLEVVASAGEGNPQSLAMIITGNDLHSLEGPVRVPYGGGIEGMLGPVRVGDEVVGMVLLEGRDFRDGAERHLDLYLPALGLGISAALTRERLERAAERDSLTGIRNRRAGAAALGQALDSASVMRSSIGVLLVDLDHFKLVNDTHGHPAGDEVLIAAARAMASALRADDVLARYGGEEFLVVCPHVDRTGLAAVAERLRRAVASSPCTWEGAPIGVTASVGGATLGEVIRGSAELLVGAADEALYAAKRTGRDRVMLAPDVASASAGSEPDGRLERGCERALDLGTGASAA